MANVPYQQVASTIPDLSGYGRLAVDAYNNANNIFTAANDKFKAAYEQMQNNKFLADMAAARDPANPQSLNNFLLNASQSAAYAGMTPELRERLLLNAGTMYDQLDKENLALAQRALVQQQNDIYNSYYNEDTAGLKRANTAGTEAVNNLDKSIRRADALSYGSVTPLYDSQSKRNAEAAQAELSRASARKADAEAYNLNWTNALDEDVARISNLYRANAADNDFKGNVALGSRMSDLFYEKYGYYPDPQVIKKFMDTHSPGLGTEDNRTFSQIGGLTDTYNLDPSEAATFKSQQIMPNGPVFNKVMVKHSSSGSYAVPAGTTNVNTPAATSTENQSTANGGEGGSQSNVSSGGGNSGIADTLTAGSTVTQEGEQGVRTGAGVPLSIDLRANRSLWGVSDEDRIAATRPQIPAPPPAEQYEPEREDIPSSGSGGVREAAEDFQRAAQQTTGNSGNKAQVANNTLSRAAIPENNTEVPANTVPYIAPYSREYMPVNTDAAASQLLPPQAAGITYAQNNIPAAPVQQAQNATTALTQAAPQNAVQQQQRQAQAQQELQEINNAIPQSTIEASIAQKAAANRASLLNGIATSLLNASTNTGTGFLNPDESALNQVIIETDGMTDDEKELYYRQQRDNGRLSQQDYIALTGNAAPTPVAGTTPPRRLALGNNPNAPHASERLNENMGQVAIDLANSIDKQVNNAIDLSTEEGQQYNTAVNDSVNRLIAVSDADLGIALFGSQSLSSGAKAYDVAMASSEAEVNDILQTINLRKINSDGQAVALTVDDINTMLSDNAAALSAGIFNSLAFVGDDGEIEYQLSPGNQQEFIQAAARYGNTIGGKFQNVTGVLTAMAGIDGRALLSPLNWSRGRFLFDENMANQAARNLENAVNRPSSAQYKYVKSIDRMRRQFKKWKKTYSLWNNAREANKNVLIAEADPTTRWTMVNRKTAQNTKDYYASMTNSMLKANAKLYSEIFPYLAPADQQTIRDTFDSKQNNK